MMGLMSRRCPSGQSVQARTVANDGEKPCNVHVPRAIITGRRRARREPRIPIIAPVNGALFEGRRQDSAFQNP